MLPLAHMPGTVASLDFRVPPHAHLSRVVREAVSDFARTHAIDTDDLSYFLMALGEALANAIEHARSPGPIEISVTIGPEQIGAIVRDHGVGFLVDPRLETSLPDVQSERGRGLPIMQRCCDVFIVESAPGLGTLVRIGRRLGATPAFSAPPGPHHAA